MTRQLRLFLVALQCYTRIPVTGRIARWMGWDPAWISPSARYFPAVGIIVGGLSALMYSAAGVVLPHGVAVLLALITGVLLTGAFHEDGLADTCDAFGCSHDRNKILTVMKDSRLGTYGVIGLLLMVMLRYETLSSISPDWVPTTLVCAAAWSRFCTLWVVRWLPHAQTDDVPGSIAKPIATAVGRHEMLIAFVGAAIPIGVMIWWSGGAWGLLTAALASAIPARIGAWYFRQRIGGYTGDCLGATQQVSEMVFQLVVLMLLLAGQGDEEIQLDTSS